jgi:hypothetical protein
MKFRNLATAALMAGAVFGVTTANAETFYLTFTQAGTPGNGCCGPFDVSATLQATASGGDYDITGISGTVTQNGTPFAITGLIAPPSDPGNYFGFDNVIVANSGNAPFSLDSGGVGFYAAGISNYYSPSEPNTAFNVYGDGGSSGTLSTTASYDVNTPFNGAYSIFAAPEPATWGLMLFGVGGLGAVMRIQRRKQAFAAA